MSMSISNGDSRNIPETISTLRVEKVTGSHLFKIMGYSLQTDNIAKGQFLRSATFNVEGYDWSIHYYPNGEKSTEEDYASIFVVLESEAKYVKAQPSFIILNENRNPLSARLTTEVFTFTSDNKYTYGFSKFVKRSAIQAGLKNDCIVVNCTVTVFKTFPVEVEPAFPLPVPPPDMQQLSHLLEAGYGADVTFEVNGETFNAHKHILAVKSKVFLAQFFGPLKKNSDSNSIIKIEDMEAPVFKSLLHFIYSETVPEFEEASGSQKKHNNKLAQHLLVAADRYDLSRLKIICENILYLSIDRGNVVALLSLAERHNCINLKTACLKYIASTGILAEVTATEQFQCLVRL